MSQVWQNRGMGKEEERTNLVSLPLPNPLTNSLSESEVISAATKQQTESISARMQLFSFHPCSKEALAMEIFIAFSFQMLSSFRELGIDE